MSYIYVFFFKCDCLDFGCSCHIMIECVIFFFPQMRLPEFWMHFCSLWPTQNKEVCSVHRSVIGTHNKEVCSFNFGSCLEFVNTLLWITDPWLGPTHCGTRNYLFTVFSGCGLSTCIGCGKEYTATRCNTATPCYTLSLLIFLQFWCEITF